MIILFIILLALARYADIWTSRRAIYYGESEANVLWRDEFGQFSTWKNALASALLIIGLTVVSLCVDYGWAGFIPFAAGSAIIALLNYQRQQKDRAKQIEFLIKVQHVQQIGGTEEDLVNTFAGRVINIVKGRTSFAGFAWIFEPDGDGAELKLIHRIAEFAMNPQFPK